MNTMNYQMLKEKKIEPKCDPTDLLLEKYNYDRWFENEEPTDTTKKKW